MPTLEAGFPHDASSSLTLQDKLAAISAHRMTAGHLPGGNSPRVFSDVFRFGNHDSKPWAAPMFHHLSEEGRAREASTLKAVSTTKGMENARPISLGTARPNGRYLPWESLSMSSHASTNDISSSSTIRDTHGAKTSCHRGESAFDLNIALNYGSAAGSPQVLRFITEHVELTHNPPYRDWATTLTCSTTSALDVVFRMLCNRGGSVLCERLSYSGVIEAAAPLGIRLFALEMDQDGLLPEVLDGKLNDWVEGRDGTKPRVLYTIPTGQNPTATTQSLERRKVIYAVAERHDLLIIEDDPYYFLKLNLPEHITTEQYLSSLPNSYLSLDTSGRVLRLETTSKILAPGLRLGWLTGPSEFVSKFISHMDFGAAFPSGPSQVMVYKLLDQQWGHTGFLEWLIDLSQQMGHSRDLLVEGCQKYLPRGACRWRVPESGMFVWVEIDAPTAGAGVLNVEDRIYRKAVSRGVKPGKGSWFAVDKKAYSAVAFRLTFAAADPDELDEAVERFASAVREVLGDISRGQRAEPAGGHVARGVDDEATPITGDIPESTCDARDVHGAEESSDCRVSSSSSSGSRCTRDCIESAGKLERAWSGNSRARPRGHHLTLFPPHDSADHTIDIELEPLPAPALRRDAAGAAAGATSSTTSAPLQPVSPSHLKRREKVCRLLETDIAMKFSHSIQFNAVPDWSSHYISYSNLKKIIYQLEKQINQSGVHKAHDGETDVESSPLLTQSGAWDDPDRIFTRKSDDELDKICSFYQLKELEILAEVEALLKDVEEFEAEHAAGEVEDGEGMGQRRQSMWARARQQSIFKSIQTRKRRSSEAGTADGVGPRDRRASIPEGREDDTDEEEDELAPLNKTQSATDHRRPSTRGLTSDGKLTVTKDLAADRSYRSSDAHSSAEVRRRPSMAFNDFGDDALQALYDEGITLKKRIINNYVNICELRSFIQLNETGFSKVFKKYDKILDRNLKSDYINSKVKPAYPFQPSTTQHLQDHLERVEEAYASIVTNHDLEAARRELRLHLREHVVWERNTVWREMIGIERKAQAANLGIRQTMLGPSNNPKDSRLQGDDPGAATKEVRTPVGKYVCPKFLVSWNFWTLVGCLAVFAGLLGVRFMEREEQQNCLALVAFVSLLWATEAIPLFVTSLLVPLLVVLLNVVRDEQPPHARLDSKKAAGYIFAAMWTPVIMLLLGGFTIAAALSKYNIAKMMATFVLSKAGTKPRTVLLTSMGVAMFASMWISNVAAPVLCFSIIQPILRNLPSDSDMSKALLLGIALASNMGGAASPIASPQNLIALENMEPQPGWGIWFFIALPVCIISILLIWILLLVTFRPGRNTTIVPIRPMKDKFTGIQYFISAVTLLTIILWCLSHQVEGIFGDMGVIAIIPIVLFFGTGILTKEDFNNFLWTIIILAAGGLALGKAVNSSGLLTTIAISITHSVGGLGPYALTCVFAALIAVVATFISHTVAALIILPLVREVGAGMAEPHPNLLVMASVLMASAAMGLPTSGFPNMTAIMMEDSQTGQRYLQVKHFLTRGVPSSVMAYVVIVSVGYGLMFAVGF